MMGVIRNLVKITEARVRQIIREEIEAQTYKQVVPALKAVMRNANTYVESIIDDNRDADAAAGLTDAVSDLNMIVKLLQRKKAPEASNMAMLARLATELADRSGFWQTPSFIGKDKHRKELATHLARMKKIANTIAASISAAGHAPRAA